MRIQVQWISLVSLILLGWGITNAFAQPTVGGVAGFDLSAYVPRETLAATSLGTVVRATGTASATGSAGAVELAATLRQDLAAEELHARLDRALITAYLGSFLELRAGLFTYGPSVADLRPSMDFYMRQDIEPYLSGRPEAARLPAPLVQLTGFVGGFYARVTALPLMLEVPFFESDSIWFPDLGFPTEVEVNFPSPGTLTLSEIIVDPYPSPSGRLDEVSIQVDAGGTLGPVDFGVFYYHGQDMRPLHTATLEFPNGLFEDYVVRLTPVYRVVDVLGGSLLGVAGPVRLYTEHAYRFSDKIVIEQLTATDTGFQTMTYETPTYTFMVGASYRNAVARLLLTAEYSDTVILEPVTRMIEPALEQALALGTTWTPYDGQLALTLLGLMSFPDHSVNTSIRLEGQSRDGSYLARLTLPLFWGEADTELGQYADIIFPTLSVEYRF